MYSKGDYLITYFTQKYYFVKSLENGRNRHIFKENC